MESRLEWFYKNVFWWKQLCGVTLVRASNGFFVIALLAMQASTADIILGLLINNLTLFAINGFKSKLREVSFERYLALIGIGLASFIILNDTHIYITLSLLIAIVSAVKDEDALRYNVNLRKYLRLFKVRRKTYIAFGSTFTTLALVITKPTIGVLADLSINLLYVALIGYFIATLWASKTARSSQQAKTEPVSRKGRAGIRHFTQTSFYANIVSLPIGLYCYPIVLFEIMQAQQWSAWKFTIMAVVGAVSGLAALWFYKKKRSKRTNERLLEYSMHALVLSLLLVFALYLFRMEIAESLALSVLAVFGLVMAELARAINTTEYVNALFTLGKKHYTFKSVMDSFFASRTGGVITGLVGLYLNHHFLGSAVHYLAVSFILLIGFHFYALWKKLYRVA